jgi:hypothetical protein
MECWLSGGPFAGQKLMIRTGSTLTFAVQGYRGYYRVPYGTGPAVWVSTT